MRPAALILLAIATTASAQTLTPAQKSRIDSTIQAIVTKTGIPSVSVGLVKNGQIVYTQAFGDARLQPEQKASAALAYPVGSISKQFTATCILLLQQDGKLTLDDTVSRWYPQLTRAKDITLRELLSHTSGYEDYAPQDYTIPAWMIPTDPLKTVETWAGKPLDFEPGTRWQYSNTNFVLAALIVQKASGMPFFDFLRTRVLKPVGLDAALDLDTQRQQLQVQGYERRALAPLRPAVLEAPGWYFGDGSLAMPVADLLRWDLSIMNRTLLTPASYTAFETEVKLRDGKPTHYALGLSVRNALGNHRILEHSGEVGGFVSENIVFPDEKMAVAVLSNQEATSAPEQIAAALAKLLLETTTAPVVAKTTKPQEAQVAAILNGLEEGKLDRTLFTPDANFYFNADTLSDFATSLKPLGQVASVVQEGESLRGGMTERSYTVRLAGGTTITVSTYTQQDGKLEQFLVEGQQ